MYQQVIKQEIAVLEKEIKEMRSNIDSGKIGLHFLSKIVDCKEIKERKSYQAELEKSIAEKEKQLIYAFNFLINH